MSLLVAAAVFITCHIGSGQDFAAFAEKLPPSIHTEIYAAGPSLDMLNKRNIVVTPFDFEDTEATAAGIAEEIARNARPNTPFVVLGVGHPLATKIARALKDRRITCLAYYDNPERYVPGGYSREAYQTILEVRGVIFANAKLAQGPIFHEPGQEMQLDDKTRIGLGYSAAIEKADSLVKRRATEQPSLRAKLLPLDLQHTKIVVYFGGNNEEYFGNGKDNKGAFPAFLRLLSESIGNTDLSHLTFVIQQHPAAKPKGIENKLIEAWQENHHQNPYAPSLLISNFGSDEAQVIADGAMYYQTSMNAQLPLQGILTTQIAHKTFEDSLVKIGFPSVTTATEFQEVIENWDELGADQASKKQQILASLGSDPNWVDTLEYIFRNPASFLQEQPGSK